MEILDTHNGVRTHSSSIKLEKLKYSGKFPFSFFGCLQNDFIYF